ncbi:MAG: GldG family protein [Elusimicrobia bacterium]|nr:GldG family protein [Elusimicrobiota bacterium]
MRESRKRALVFSWAGAGLVLAILAALNAVGHFLYLRADFSAGGIYSVSRGTKRILGGLKDNLVIKVYYSPGLPSPYGLNEQFLRALLAEFKKAGRGKVKLSFLDPDDNENAKKEALTAGVSPVRLNVMARDKFEIKEALMGMALLYKGKTETIPLLQNTAEFEYDIARRIKKLSAANRKTIGLTTGHGEKSAQDETLQPVFAAMGDLMDIETVDLFKPVPANVEALWMLGPAKAFKPAELERVKAWVGAGKSLGLLLDRRYVDLKRFFSVKADLGLEVLLKDWGVDMRDGFVVDARCERIQLQQQTGGFIMMNLLDYAFIPVASDFDTRHPATRGLDAVSLPFVHPIAFRGEGKPLRYTPLVRSSASSWYVTNDMVSPYERLGDLDKAEKGPFSLAGIIEGDFYKVTPSTYAATDAAAPGTSAPGRVVLVGTSRIIHPGLSIKPVNVAMLLNLIEWTLQDESLLSIRSKGLTYRPFRELSAAAKFAVKNAMIFSLPLALVGAGLAVYRRQQKRRRALPSVYGP